MIKLKRVLIAKDEVVTKGELEDAIAQAVQQKRMRVDKISLLSGYGSPQASKDILKQRLLNLKGDERYKVTGGGKDDNYHFARIIRSRSDKRRYLHITYEPIESPKARLHYIRVEFSPQHFDEIQLKEIIDWLADKENLGNIIRKVLQKSVVSRVDIAFDVDGFRPRDFYIGLVRRFTGTVTYGIGGYIVGWRIGSSKSDVHLSTYEKMMDESVEGTVKLAKDKSFTRFEFRRWTNESIMSMETIKNPFAEVKMYSKSVQDDPSIPKWFKLLINLIPISVAMHSLEDENQRDRIQRRLDKHMVNFDADSIWKLWPECIEKLNSISAVLADQSHKL